jgi:hypothetical protein
MTPPQHEKRGEAHRLVTNLGGLPDLTQKQDPFGWEPNLYDWRHSRVLADKRSDAGEVVPVCQETVPLVGVCGAELDVSPVPHHPRCPVVAKTDVAWTRERIVEALLAASTDGVHAPGRLDWAERDRQGRRPTHAIVAAEFGNWTTAVKAAGLKTQPKGKPMKGRKKFPPREEIDDGNGDDDAAAG